VVAGCGGPLPTREAEQYLEPAQRSSDLSAFCLSLFAYLNMLFGTYA